MPTGSDDATGGDPEEGPVLSPEELDISADERVKELEEGRYVVSSGDPIADDEPVGQLDAAKADATPMPAGDDEPTDQEPTAPEPDAPTVPDPAPEPEASTGEFTEQSVHEWLSEDLGASNSRYGFDITAAFDGSISQQRMVSNDVVTIFESLVMWYAQQIDRNTPVEEVLGILLMEANAPVRYPPGAVKRAMQSAGLTPDDTIADLMTAVSENDGLQL
ncbi:MAG: hypothetical protein ABEJ31_07515 [Haloarculaceae archaeon]